MSLILPHEEDGAVDGHRAPAELLDAARLGGIELG